MCKNNFILIAVFFQMLNVSLLANIEDWDNREELACVDHYRVKHGNVSLVRQWVGTKESNFTQKNLLRKVWAKEGDVELIVVHFWLDDKKRRSAGWIYKIVNGNVIVWGHDAYEEEREPLAVFYKRIEKLMKNE